MFISEIRIENFRRFGEGDRALVLPLRRGLTALVGENDSGKTTIADALRFALGTRDQEFVRLDETDFHQPPASGARRTSIQVRCKFADLSPRDVATFVEYLTYEEDHGHLVSVLYLNWTASATPSQHGSRRSISVDTKAGRSGDGPSFDSAARAMLSVTYLRPLRDAERALSAGRGSRLSQILQYTPEIKKGEPFDASGGAPADASRLSIVGIGDYANALLGSHDGVKAAQKRLNSEYLKSLSFSGDLLAGEIAVTGLRRDEDLRLRQLLEKLDLGLRDQEASEPASGRGLGSNNLLFMACELLLLGADTESVPTLVIEEPEAHLHPQRQLRLMRFLQGHAEGREGGRQIQVVVTTHSPHLASAIHPENLVLLQGGRAFPLCRGKTLLTGSDYGFLERFLDVTKANLFFARGVLIVEGSAEAILLPTLARLLELDLTEHGVSIVNVGGTGLSRFARIFQRKEPQRDGTIDVPVACVTDLDVMPDCAPAIVDAAGAGEPWSEKKRRRWRARADFTPEELRHVKDDIDARATGQQVATFVADEWTLEYDLAYSGLCREVWIATQLAKADADITAGTAKLWRVGLAAARSYEALRSRGLAREEHATHVYARIVVERISKPTVAQYLARILEVQKGKRARSCQGWRSVLPPYLIGAIDHVTRGRAGVGDAAAAPNA